MEGARIDRGAGAVFVDGEATRVDAETPDAVLMRREEAGDGEDLEMVAQAVLVLGEVMAFFFADGPHPGHVAKRGFLYLERWLGAGVADAGRGRMMCGDGAVADARRVLAVRAWQQWECRWREPRDGWLDVVAPGHFSSVERVLVEAGTWRGELLLRECASAEEIRGAEVLRFEPERGQAVEAAVCRRLALFLVADGCGVRGRPGVRAGFVVRRAFLLGLRFYGDLLGGMNLSQVANLLGQDKQGFSAWAKKVCEPLFAGGMGLKMEMGRRRYAEVQRGNRSAEMGSVKKRTAADNEGR